MYSLVATVVLLVVMAIIFVTSPQPCGGYFAELPVLKNPDVFFGLDSFMKVTVKADGSTFVGTDWVPSEQLAENIPRRNKGIVIAADWALPYGTIKATLAMVASSQPERVFLLTESQTSPFERMIELSRSKSVSGQRPRIWEACRFHSDKIRF